MSAPTPAPALSVTNTALLAGIAGFVDTATFVALHGVFAAHVTGNFVLLGAALALGSGGIIAKLATFPVFMVTVVAARHLARLLPAPGRPLLAAEGLFLILFWLGATWLGPFDQADSPALILVACLAVVAMAIQNAMMRIAFPSATPTTIMTGNTTGAMIDLADWMAGRLPPEGLARLKKVAKVLLGFAVGCALGAIGHVWIGPVGFLLPVLGIGWLLLRAP